ncbi:uncharacterized protein VP01_4274g3 [Puccinia sorghi]|uniref:DDE Tnp4 domain-containing protein n=1 Tax=Puccinia sorghi TaxID=27349 RepID=A0A0L6UQA8_9BASI|nr:uncharacterized protein VP01_4274g3 [Puccinia sorghi]
MYYFDDFSANEKEIFNLRHATLQNVVKRTFGAWKKRFPILKNTVDYDLDTQHNLVFALGLVLQMSMARRLLRIQLSRVGNRKTSSTNDTMTRPRTSGCSIAITLVKRWQYHHGEKYQLHCEVAVVE